MANVAVANSDAAISGKNIDFLESDQTITGLKTFSRGAAAPFAVAAGSTNVANLDADKLDGLESTVFARWDGLGSSLGQIKFPAVQSASTDANILDDYEEGTFTPVIGGAGGTSGQTYSTQAGNYLKIGRKVFVQAYTVFTAKGTITGGVQLQGLPFTSYNSGTALSVLTMQWFSAATNWVNMSAEIIPNSLTAGIWGATAAAAGLTQLATADIANNTQLLISGVYMANA